MATDYNSSIYKTEIKFNNIMFRIKTNICVNMGNFEHILKLSSKNRNKLHDICMQFLSTNDKKILENKVIKNIFLQAIEFSKKKNNILLWINNFFEICEKINHFLLTYNGKELKDGKDLIYYL